jgi:Zn-dependent protease with chaperone function
MAAFQATDVLHPLDRAARQQLEGIPLLQSAVKKYLKLVSERRDRNWLLSNAIRLGPDQLPEIYRMLPPVCVAFGIPEPELYLMRGPANAMTMGHSRTVIVLHDQILEDLAEDEIQAVIAHECGHALCEHVLYRQMALAVQGVGAGVGALGGTAGAIAGLASVPLQLALLNWFRKSELTADRAAALFMGSGEPMERALFHLLGVPKWFAGEISFARFAAQTVEFDALNEESKWDRFLSRKLESGLTHPIPTIRIRELTTWTESSEFRQLVASAGQGTKERASCPTCGVGVDPSWRFCQRCGATLCATEAIPGPELASDAARS